MKNLYIISAAVLVLAGTYWYASSTTRPIDNNNEVAYNDSPVAALWGNSGSDTKSKITFAGDAQVDTQAFRSFMTNSSPASPFQLPNTEFNLSKFQVSSPNGEFSTDIHFSTQNNDNKEENIHFDHQASFESSKEAYANWQNEIDGLYKQLQDPNSQVDIDPQFREIILCCHDALKGLIPKWEELGKTYYKHNFDIKLKEPNNNYEGSQITVKNFDFVANPYGIKSHGDATITQNALSGTYVINITNYKKLITDGVDYYNRALGIAPNFAHTDPRNLPQPITSNQVNDLINYIKYISDKPDSDSNDVTITIDFVDKNNVKIGTRTSQDAMNAWHKINWGGRQQQFDSSRRDQNVRQPQPIGQDQDQDNDQEDNQNSNGVEPGYGYGEKNNSRFQNPNLQNQRNFHNQRNNQFQHQY